MNERIEKLAIEAGLLNYVDNETPRRYFIDGNADLEEVQKFAKLIVQEVCWDMINSHLDKTKVNRVAKHWGVDIGVEE